MAGAPLERGDGGGGGGGQPLRFSLSEWWRHLRRLKLFLCNTICCSPAPAIRAPAGRAGGAHIKPFASAGQWRGQTRPARRVQSGLAG